MYSATAITQQPVSDWKIRVRSTVVWATRLQGVFEQRIAALEGGHRSLAVASAAAIPLHDPEPGKTGRSYHFCNNICLAARLIRLAHTLVDYGVTTTFVAPPDYDKIEASFQENTKALYIETLGQPQL